MNKTNENQRGVLTDIGQEKINAHAVAGTKLTITQFVIGDGNGEPVEPIKTATSLIHEIGRESITETTPGIVSGGIFMSPEMALKYQGQWIREAGLVDSDGDLIVWCSYAPTLISQFTEREIIINIPIISNDTISIVIDATKKWVTQEQLDTKLDKTATAENSKSLNGKTADELSSGNWSFIREIKWPITAGEGVLLGTVGEVLRNEFRVVGYNSDRERVYIDPMFNIGFNSNTQNQMQRVWDISQLLAGGWTGANATMSTDSYQTARFAIRRSSWIVGNFPNKQMTLCISTDDSEPNMGNGGYKSIGTAFATVDLARLGFSKSDDLYLFMQHGTIQKLDSIKIYKRNS